MSSFFSQNGSGQPSVEEVLNSMLVSQTATETNMPDIPNPEGESVIPLCEGRKTFIFAGFKVDESLPLDM